MSVAAASSSKETVHVVFITDQNYVNLTAVALRSLVAEFERGTGRHAHALSICVVCVGVLPEGKIVLEKAVGAGDAGVSLVFVDHALDPVLQGKERWRRLVSLKVCLPEILGNLDRVIFLDSDIVVVDDICKLWQIDLEGRWLGVVPCLLDDPACLDNYNIFKVRFDEQVVPVNAGVLILDLAQMRRLGVTETLMSWQNRNSEKVRLPEQEAISVNYPGQWKALPHAWNYRPFGETYWAAASWEDFRQYLEVRPSIVHFQANVRPFDLKLDLPYYREWWSYHQQVTPDWVLRRKMLSYFQFVFFEYPEMFCRLSNLLPRGLIRFALMVTLLGLCVLPVAIIRYGQYLLHPEAYRLRIYRYLARPAGRGS